MPGPLPTTTVTLQDGTRSGHYYSPNNGASAQPGGVSVPLILPGGWGVVGVSQVRLNANTTYFGGIAAYIDVTLIRSSGNTYLGQGAIGGDGDSSGNFTVNGGLRNTGLPVYNINNGSTPPIMDCGAVYYQITMGGDASAIIMPFQSGISVEIDVVTARYPRRITQII